MPHAVRRLAIWFTALLAPGLPELSEAHPGAHPTGEPAVYAAERCWAGCEVLGGRRPPQGPACTSTYNDPDLPAPTVTDPVYWIPVRFVVTNPPSSPLPDRRLREQIAAFNESFSGQLAEFAPGAPSPADTRIRFYLKPRVDDFGPTPSCNPEDEDPDTACLPFHALRTPPTTRSPILCELLTRNALDPLEELLIYTADMGAGSQGGDTQEPAAVAGCCCDGAVVDWDLIGKDLVLPLSDPDHVYDQGGAVTHEVGHYLGLLHTHWLNLTEGCDFSDFTRTECPDQGECPGEEDCSRQGDLVCDTGPEFVAHRNCGARDCDGNLVLNFVSKVADDCAGGKRFTAGQAARMRCILETIRSGIRDEVDGHVVDSDGFPMRRPFTVRFTDSDGLDVTVPFTGDSFQFPQGWEGRMTPHSREYTFSPASLDRRAGDRTPVLFTATHNAFQGIVTGDVTWTGTVVLTGDVEIGPGATLNLDPGSEIVADEVRAGETAEIRVRGRLEVHGAPQDPVVLSSDVAGARGPLIRVVETGSVSLEHATFRDCDVGVAFAGLGGGIEVTRCRFENTREAAVSVSGGASFVRILENEITVRSGVGIRIDGATAEVSGNAIRRSHDGASDPEDAVGIRVLRAAAVVTLADNTVSGFAGGAGIALEGGAGTLTSNLLAENGVGIRVAAGTWDLVGGNRIVGNLAHGLEVVPGGAGSCLAAASVRVRGGEILRNAEAGVWTASGDCVDLGRRGDPGGNRIQDNRGMCVTNASPCPVTAYGNDWGDCAGPACADGAVDDPAPLCRPVPNDPVLPLRTALLAAAPNPFRDAATLEFALAAAAPVNLVVFDGLGRVVRVVDLGERPMGSHAWTWDGRDDRGARVSAGSYLIRFRAGRVQDTRKLIYLP